MLVNNRTELNTPWTVRAFTKGCKKEQRLDTFRRVVLPQLLHCVCSIMNSLYCTVKTADRRGNPSSVETIRSLITPALTHSRVARSWLKTGRSED